MTKRTFGGCMVSFFTLCMMMLVLSAPTYAQDGPLSHQETAEVVEDLIKWLEAEYVLPEVADQYDEPFHLTTMYDASQEPEEIWTLREVPGKRFSEADIYILISPRTGSGCEAFSYNLKHHGRAVLIGEKTRGTGHRGTYRPVGTQFQAFIPRSRPVHPVTGTGFEGVGVIPNYEAPVDEALDVAYRMALQRLASTTEDPEQKSRIEALLNKQGAQQILDQQIPGRRMSRSVSNGVTDTVDVDLQEYAGNYGDRTISVEKGSLYIQREAPASQAPGRQISAPKLKLLADGKDEFVLEQYPSGRVKFVRDDAGAIVEVQVLTLQGQWETSKRDGP